MTKGKPDIAEIRESVKFHYDNTARHIRKGSFDDDDPTNKCLRERQQLLRKNTLALCDYAEEQERLVAQYEKENEKIIKGNRERFDQSVAAYDMLRNLVDAGMPFGASGSVCQDHQHICTFCSPKREQLNAALTAAKAMLDGEGQKLKRPRVVCLCGSTRFMEAFHNANARLSLAGEIVLTVEIVTYDGATDPQRANVEQKKVLDELHCRKIDISDYVLVLNVGGYIGESTRNEINYAKKISKPIEYLEPCGHTESGTGDNGGL